MENTVKFTREMESMIQFLRNMNIEATDSSGRIVDTKIGIDDGGSGYIYMGLEDTHNIVGGKTQRGSVLQKKDKVPKIITGGLFTKEIVKEMQQLKGTEYDDYYQLFDALCSYKKLLYPINFCYVTREDGKQVVKETTIKSKYNQDSELTVGKIRAVYSGSTKRCQLEYIFKQKNGNTALKSNLTDYLELWCRPNVAEESLKMIEFSTGNYIKTIVITDRRYKLVLDSFGCYYGAVKDKELKYVSSTEDLLYAGSFHDLILANDMSDAFRNFLTLERFKLFENHAVWIIPYKCGDAKIITIK